MLESTLNPPATLPSPAPDTQRMAHNTVQIIQTLSLVPCIARAPNTLITRLVDASAVRHYAKGETLFSRGQPIDQIIVVQAGLLEVSISKTVNNASHNASHNATNNASGQPDNQIELNQRTGARYVAAHTGRGGIFGMISLMSTQTSVYDIRALSEVTVVCLPRSTLMACAHEDAQLMDGILSHVCHYARQASEALAQQCLMNTRQRLVQTLLRLCGAQQDLLFKIEARKELLAATASQARRSALVTQVEDSPYKPSSTDLRPVISPQTKQAGTVVASQSDLSDMLGISRQTLNAELKKLATEGFLSVHYGHIDIPDTAALKSLL